MKPIRWTRHPWDWWRGAGHWSPEPEPLWKMTVLCMLDMKTVGNNFNNLHSKTWQFALHTMAHWLLNSVFGLMGWLKLKTEPQFSNSPSKNAQSSWVLRNQFESFQLRKWTCYSFGGADRFRSSLGLRAATQGCTVVPRVFRAYTNWYLSSPTCHSVPSWHWILILQAHFTVTFLDVLQVQNPDAVMARGFPLCCAQRGFGSEAPLHAT